MRGAEWRGNSSSLELGASAAEVLEYCMYLSRGRKVQARDDFCCRLQYKMYRAAKSLSAE